MKRKLQLLLLLLLAMPIGMLAQGNSWQTATLINNGSSGSAALDDKTGEAYFKIVVPEEGRALITMTLSGDLSMNWVDLCWYRSSDGEYHSRTGTGWYPENGATIDMTNAGKGTYYLRAQRRGGKGTVTLKYQFTPCSYANDAEPNDDWGTGTTLESGKTVEGRIGYRDEKDYVDDNDCYKIVVTEDGRVDLTYQFDQTYELKMNWIDMDWYRASDGSYQGRKSTGWYPEANGTLTITNVSKGTYYFKMQRRGGHGGYKLKYVFTPSNYTNDIEDNDNDGQGTEILMGETVQGHLGYVDGKDYCDKDDCYKITVPQDGRVQLIFNCEQTYDLSLNWVDVKWYRASDGSYQGRDGSGWYPNPNDTVTITNAAKGTYYVHMQRRDGHGGYTMKYIFTPNRYGNDIEDNDEDGKGTEIAMGQTIQGHIGYLDGNNYRDENDCYKLEVPKDGRVQLIFNLEQTYDLRLNWVDIKWYRASDGTYHGRDGSGWYPNPNDTVTIDDASKGTYYVHMQRRDGHGGYTMKYIFTPNNYANDTEPNDEREQATDVLKNGSSITGHLGYKDGNDKRDDNDWIKIDTKNASTMMVIRIVPDSTSTLAFNWVDIRCVKGDKDNTAESSGWYPKGPINLLVNNLDYDATYYIHLQRNSGHGGYTVTYNAVERAAGSDIRISAIGRGTTRYGISSPMDIKVENIGSNPTGSFYIALPATPDIEFLSAKIPTEDGVMEVDREEFAFYDAEEGDCAVFVMPNLGPFESYTFTIYTQGIVSNAARSNRVAPPDKQKVYASAMKYSEKKSFGDNFSWQAFAEDGTSVALVDAFVDTYIFPEEQARGYSKAIGEADHGYRASYRAPVANPITHYTTKIIQKANPVMAIPNALVASGKIANAVVTGLRRRFWSWIYKEIGLIKDEPQVMDGDNAVNGIVRSWDPNEMCGPVGYGDKHYIAETKTMDYRILFENKAEATDNAYRIIIDDQLDENIFDVSTVRFGAMSHEGADYNWKVSRDGNKLKWEIEGIELPPNVNAPEGEGYVSFSVDLKPGLANGTQIKNKAAIRFDYNEVIETNEYVNTLDLAAPTTTMKSVAKQDNGKFVVTCEGSDSESGISHYLFYASKEGEDYQYLGQSKEPSFTFDAGQTNANYSIIAYAVDNVGNTQNSAPEALIFNPTGIRTVNAIADDQWTINRLNGTSVAKGKGVPDLNLPAGVYIIRQGNNVRKVIIK